MSSHPPLSLAGDDEDSTSSTASQDCTDADGSQIDLGRLSLSRAPSISTFSSQLHQQSSLDITDLTNDVPETPVSVPVSSNSGPPGHGPSNSPTLGLALSLPPPSSESTIERNDAQEPAVSEDKEQGVYVASPTAATALHGLDLHSPRAKASGRPGSSDGAGSPLSRSRTLPRIKSWSRSPKPIFANDKPLSYLEEDSKRNSEVLAHDSGEPMPLDAEKRLALARWILAVAVVNFDLDVGPVVERLYPDVLMTPAVRENIAFSSFPDGSLFETGVQCHSFRIRDALAPITPSPSSISRQQSDGFLYGYSLFLQKRDPNIKRGYLQRSVTILSHLPFPSLFAAAIAKLGAFYFSHGITMLETACSNIASWPDPTPGNALELGFLGSVMQVEIPRSENEHQSIATSSFGEKFNMKIHILASLPPPLPSPVSLFASFLPKIWTLWECLVLSEPLIIFAPSPSQTSSIIWWLRDFLRPIPLAGDFRPYFHIHDQDYAILVNKNPPKAGLILGVTNPFFGNLCKHWPHILSVGRAGDAAKTTTQPRSTPFMGPEPGFHTQHKRFISKDRALLKKLEEAVQKGGAAEIEACTLLRQHFTDRTTKLLVPLNRHFQSLIPIDPKAPLKPFTPSSFLASLKAHGSLLPFRSSSKQREFYERWLRTPAFGVWLTQRVGEVQEVLQRRAAGGSS